MTGSKHKFLDLAEKEVHKGMDIGERKERKREESKRDRR